MPSTSEILLIAAFGFLVMNLGALVILQYYRLLNEWNRYSAIPGLFFVLSIIFYLLALLTKTQQ